MSKKYSFIARVGVYRNAAIPYTKTRIMVLGRLGGRFSNLGIQNPKSKIQNYN